MAVSGNTGNTTADRHDHLNHKNDYNYKNCLGSVCDYLCAQPQCLKISRAAKPRKVDTKYHGEKMVNRFTAAIVSGTLFKLVSYGI